MLIIEYKMHLFLLFFFQSTDTKISNVRGLIVQCKECEAKYIVRGCHGKLRIGLAEKTLLTAVANALTTIEAKNEGL